MIKITALPDSPDYSANEWLTFQESLFATMTPRQWSTALEPKVQGTWNLHRELRVQGKEKELDFLVLTSSISGSVGTATESNYCAANAFQDAFARYCRHSGLPAVSIGLGMISEVGYLHEHPDIQALLLRKGLHPISEAEMLQIFDIALAAECSPHQVRSKHANYLSNGHMLTGLEDFGLSDQRDQGFEGSSHVLKDPRAGIIAGALDRKRKDPKSAKESQLGKQQSNLSPELQEAVSAGASVVDAVQSILAKKISNLVLVPAETLQDHTRLSEFGFDSMLAAEFRTFCFHNFGVDIPFMTMLGLDTSVKSLAATVASSVEAQL